MRGYGGSVAKFACVVAMVGSLSLSSYATAADRVQFLAARLKYPPSAGSEDDFRVRTTAALALGASDDDAAVAPLCGGLSDPSDVVRGAVAVALRRLARASSADCLRRRVAVESKAAVVAELQRAVEAVDRQRAAQAAADVSANAENAKYYVALSHVINRTSRPSPEVESLVREAIASELRKSGDYLIAPVDETLEGGRRALQKRALKGYYLSISVERFDYSDDGLRVRVKIAVFSYPSKDLRGDVPAGATLPGARPGDMGAENQLMTLVAARAAGLFAQNFR